MRDRDIELGRFLRSRREAMCPENIDLPTYGSRRVSGLRREELAMLAGVSVSYYTRIEQGQAGGVSLVVLDALARVLHLDDDERAHLHRLGRDSAGPTRTPAAGEVLRPGLLGLVQALRTVPAAVLGRGMDVLAWNRSAHALFMSHLPFDAVDDPWTRPNWARLLFCDERCRAAFIDWEPVARDLVGRLRAADSRSPADPIISAVVQDLLSISSDFERLWRSHPVAERPLGTVRLRHRWTGEFELSDEVLRSAQDPDQVLISFHAEPGSVSAAALDRIAASPEGTGGPAG